MYKTKIIAVGGFGDIALSNIHKSIKAINQDIQLISVNTDSQSQDNLPDSIQKIMISEDGHGSGGNPAKAYEQAKFHHESIHQATSDADVIFLISGMGKGTGSGASAYIAEVCNRSGIFTVGIFRSPESSDGIGRCSISEEYGERTSKNCDAFLNLCNDDVLRFAESNGVDDLIEAYSAGDVASFDAIRALVSIVNNFGIRNVDLNDFKATVNGRFAVKTGSHDEFSTDCSLFNLNTLEARSALSVIELPTEKPSESLRKTMAVRAEISRSLNDSCNIITGVLSNPNIIDVSVIYIISGFEKTLSEKRAEAGRLGGQSFSTSKIKQNDLI